MADHGGYGAPGNSYPYGPASHLYPNSNHSNPSPNFPSYTPTPPIPSEYSKPPPAPVYNHPASVNASSEPDPSYSPRVPEYDRLSFDANTANSGYASAPSWEYQPINRASRYNAVDPYNQGNHGGSAAFGDDHQEAPPTSASAYYPQKARSGYDHLQAPATSVSGYDRPQPPPTSAARSGYDHLQAPANSVSGYDRPQPPPTNGAGYDHFQAPPASVSGYDHLQPPPTSENGYDRHQASPASVSGYDHFKSAPTSVNGYDRLQAPPASVPGYDHLQARPTSVNGYDRLQAPPASVLGYDHLQAPPTSVNGYDRLQAPPASVPGYDHLQAPPTSVSGYDHLQAPPTSVPGYDHFQAPPTSVSGYDHQAPVPSAPGYDDHRVSRLISPPSAPPAYDYQVPPHSGSWYERQTAPSQPAGYDYDKPATYPSSGYDRAYGDSARDYSSSGVYAYNGGNSLPYGARGTGGSSWNSDPLGDLPKLAKALPKPDTETKGTGVEKFYVKLLQDSSSGSPMEVVCQIGLDGLRLFDRSLSKTLRIHPLDTITKWDVDDASTFAFWTKTTVDYEPRITRLQSSRRTINAILDTLTAACLQLSDMVDNLETKKSLSNTTNDSSATSSIATTTEVQKAGWFSTPAPEEKEHWVPDDDVSKCRVCDRIFTAWLRRHHCRNCGDIFCVSCTQGRIALTNDADAQRVRVCDRCLAEITHRLTNSLTNKTESSSSKPVVPVQQTHDDLAKRLQEQIERNVPGDRKGSSKIGQRKCNRCGTYVVDDMPSCSNCGADTPSLKDSRKRTKEVACPTCTVHLEVEVPLHGSTTVECGVCQHPFLVK